MHLNTPRLLALLALTGGLAACSDGGGPSTGSQVTFSVGTRASDGAPLQTSLLDNTLVLDKVEVAVRDISFKRVEDSGCPEDDDAGATPQGDDGVNHDGEHDDGGDDDGHDGHDDACESFNTGPMLISLPLTPGVERAFQVAVDAGTFDQLRIKIVSIHAMGKFNGNSFDFTTDLNAKQKIRLIPPLTVTDPMTNVPVTIKVDLDSWFKDENGNFVDPMTNEQLVKDNIKDSFHAFRDGNHDCHDDDGSDDD